MFFDINPYDDNTREYFNYLDNLRESGVTNMFVAGPYLQKQFGLDRNKAQTVLLEWMQWVNDNPDNRDK
jgi:hypothetical protein